MGCFCYSLKNEDNEEFLIKQNKELIEQNEIIVSTSIDLIESINKLGEKITLVQNTDNNNPISNLIIHPNPNQNQIINNNNEDNHNIINIVFILEGKKYCVPINKNRPFLEAIQSLQKKEIICNDLNKIEIIHNSTIITENVIRGDIISDIGINTDTVIKVSFRN